MIHGALFAFAALASAFAVAGCATQVTTELPVIDADRFHVQPEAAPPTTLAEAQNDDLFEVSGIWRRSLEPFERPEAVLVAAKPDVDKQPPKPAPQTALDRLLFRSQPQAPPRPQVVAPKSRRARPVRPEGQRATKSAAHLARDHYLDYPTRVVGQRITFYCPADVAREIRIKADDVRQTHPLRRLARGNARVTCRELTLEADRITIRIREEPDADLQISARGNATLVSTVRGQEQREEGVRSLLVTNDNLVPLR